ncbi:hypothetical protein HDR58_04455 [bacterium]|nr:hypothetical protein [bacterium]
MGIEATSSTSVTTSSQVSSASNSNSAQKASNDASFKDEMDKVSSNDTKTEEKDLKSSDKDAESKMDLKTTQDKNNNDAKLDKDDNDNQILEGNIDYQNFSSISLNDANTMLSNNIMQMMNVSEMSKLSGAKNIFAFGSNESLNNVSMTENDAQFFINLTQNNDLSSQNIIAQAQTMIAVGMDSADVAQNVKISQTLLNALSNARETNQPLRIDFDQNISVILRIGKDGALAAHFIPGDRAVEQYLRNNISTLKATFNENDLPYTDLSYSNSSKQQNERRRNKQQQGE